MIRNTHLLSSCFVLLVLLTFNNAVAQEGKKDFVGSENQGWMVNVEEAYQLSEKTNKPILANFTGSDWCGWCKKLKKEVFSQPEFIEWAANNVILLELDYPRRTALPEAQKRQNAELQQAFRVTGFPTIWMFDLDRPDGNRFQIQAYGKTGYAAGGPSAYIKNLDKMIELKEKSVN
ncbi:MAG: thioredoxin family protein [Reichenbachiella sp.]|uniref:thioredoxin family protein n=1 Tax=Reichenbachiella sp. TaxID=2184521 RepID=UPI003267C7F1